MDHQKPPSLLLLQSSFFKRAESVAERNVREWIRKTLQEVFLRGFQQVLTGTVIQNDRPTTTTTMTTRTPPPPPPINTGTVTLQELEQCFDLVQSVSDAWQNELRSVQHFRTADWVHEMWEFGKANLWSVEWTAEQWNQRIMSTTNNNQHNEDDDDENYVTGNPSVRDMETHITAHGTNLENSTGSIPQIPYCELRKLGRVTTCKESLPETNDALFKLQQMGEKGQSYWPLDHQMLDDLAKSIPKRQRWERKTPTKKPKFHVVIPKPSTSLPSGIGDNTEGDEDEEMSRDPQETATSTMDTTSERIFAAVLKKCSSKIKTPKLPSKRKRVGLTNNTFQQDDVPRQPSTISASSYNVHKELTPHEKEELNRLMIHPDDDEIDADCYSMATIFGELQNVGMTYAKIEEAKKGSEQGNSLNMTERQRRRHERAYIKQRLAPRRIQKNQDPQKYRSKVLRTEQQCEDGTTKTFLEFDLGWSLVEYDEEGEKRLMVFSSIQATLEELESDRGSSIRELDQQQTPEKTINE